MFSLAENTPPDTPRVRAAGSLLKEAPTPYRCMPAAQDATVAQCQASPQPALGPARRASHLPKPSGPPASGCLPNQVSIVEASAEPSTWVPGNPRLAQLAEQIRQLRCRGRPAPTRCLSGLPELDHALGGGFITGSVHELLAAREGVAAYSVALRLASRVAGDDKWIIYIQHGARSYGYGGSNSRAGQSVTPAWAGDSSTILYPPGAAQLGVPLGRLIVVRVSHPTEALWVCEQSLRCQAVAAVVLPLRSIDAYASRRLQLAAEAGGNLGLLIRGTEPNIHTFAASRVRFDPLPGPIAVRRMLVTVLKVLGGRPSGPFVVELSDAADFMPAHALSVDRAGAARCCGRWAAASIGAGPSSRFVAGR